MTAALVAGCVLAAALLVPRPGVAAADRLREMSAGTSRRPRSWWRRVARRPLRPRLEVDASLVLDLVAAVLAAGASVPAALGVVGDAVGGRRGGEVRSVADRLRLGAREEAAWSDAGDWTQEMRRALTLSARTGAPAARLLRDRAEELRRRRRRDASAAAQRLAVRVVLPLGLCALPGFAAWGVVPVVLGLAARVMAP